MKLHKAKNRKRRKDVKKFKRSHVGRGRHSGHKAPTKEPEFKDSKPTIFDLGEK
jgi:hypothetical protein